MTTTDERPDLRYWYQVPASQRLPLEQLVELLKPMGVRLREPMGRSVYFRDEESGLVLQEAGSIAVYGDGRICVWPRVDVAESVVCVLLASAEEAFRNKPRKSTGWHLRRKGQAAYWSTVVLVRAPDEDAVVMAMRAQHEMDRDRAMFEERLMVTELVDGSQGG